MKNTIVRKRRFSAVFFRFHQRRRQSSLPSQVFIVNIIDRSVGLLYTVTTKERFGKVSRMDGRAMRGEETYLKIIDSTLDIISEQGIGGVSAAKVSQGAGISKSNVFHHFKSVDEILVATLNTVIDRMIGETKREDAHTLTDLFDSLEHALFQEDEDSGKIEKAFFAFYNESMFHDTYREIFRGFLEESLYELENTLTRVGVENSGQLPRLIIAMLDGLSIQLLIMGDKERGYEAWETFRTMALELYREDR